MKIITNLVAMVHTNIFRQVAHRFPASRNKNTIPNKCSIIIALLLLFTCSLSYGQVNLVKNPSFEKRFHNFCWNNPQTIKIAEYWSGIDTQFIDTLHPIDTFHIIGNYFCTPDYCSSCDDSLGSMYGVPLNGMGFQYAHTGNAYASMVMYRDTSFTDSVTSRYWRRDYLMGRLYHPLIAGQSYCVTFYVSLANLFGHFIINNIGAYLDDGSIDTVSNCGLPHTEYTPQINCTTLLPDTSGWMKIIGNFIANGTERYITIGNFFSNAATDTVWTSHFSGGGNGNATYYYVDDVSVIASNATAYAGLDKWISPGDTTAIGLDSNGEGMPCYWYKLGELSVIDSGGTIQVHPTTTATYTVAMDLCGTITYDTVTVHVVPLHSILLKMNNINIYPNPTKSEVTIVGAEGCEVLLHDMMGAVQSKTKTATAKEMLDISYLPSGIYCIELIDTETGMKVVKRVVKE
jgi:Secretion system C-terminal sorting domain